LSIPFACFLVHLRPDTHLTFDIDRQIENQLSRKRRPIAAGLCEPLGLRLSILVRPRATNRTKTRLPDLRQAGLHALLPYPYRGRRASSVIAQARQGP
jgi:hypothetical protein